MVLCLQVLIVDEVNTAEEVEVLRSMIAGGIRVVAGASACTSLASLIRNPHLNALVTGSRPVPSPFEKSSGPRSQSPTLR